MCIHTRIHSSLGRKHALHPVFRSKFLIEMFGTWQDSHNIYILMPYAAGGELLHFIQEKECLGEGDTMYTLLCIVYAYTYSVGSGSCGQLTRTCTTCTNLVCNP